MGEKKINSVRAGAFFIIFIFSGLAHALAAPLLNPNNYHYYEAISGGIDWDLAKTNAESFFFNNVRGHLATLTSAEENLWVWENLEVVWENSSQPPLRYYLGATDVEEDGVWEWVTAEPWDYTNWNTGEPNNLWVPEDALSFWDNNKWNDLPMLADYWGRHIPYVRGYIVEYDANFVPEPASGVLFSAGAALSGLFSRRLKKTKRPA